MTWGKSANIVLGAAIALVLATAGAGACTQPPQEEWTASERAVWTEICDGRIADLRTITKAELSFDHMDQWPPESELSARFLTTVLTDPAYVAATPYSGVQIFRARFREPLDLQHLELRHFLRLAETVFEMPVNLRQMHSAAEVDFHTSWFRWRAEKPDTYVADTNLSLDLTAANLDSGLNLNFASVGPVGLQDSRLGANLAMYQTLIDGDLNLYSARIDGNADLRDVKLTGDLLMNFTLIRGNFLLGAAQIIARPAAADGTISGGKVDGANARIGGRVSIGPADDNPATPAASCKAFGDAAAAASAAATAAPSPDAPAPAAVDAKAAETPAPPPPTMFRARSISLIGANIEGEVSIRKAEAIDNSVVWALSLEDARVGDDLWITGSHFAHVTLSGMTVNGFALLQGTTVDYNFLADSLRIGKAVWMSPETRIQGVLNLSSSWVGGDIDFAGAQVIGAPILRSLTTGGDLNMNCGTTFEAPLSAAFAKIGDNLDMTQGRFASVDLTGAEIGAELRLADANQAAQFQAGSQLSLRNVMANSLRDLPNSWPQSIDIEGFTYQRIGGSNSDHPITERADDDLINWLARQEPFSPQPYAQLAGVLKQSGNNEKAKAILFAGKARERAQASGTTKFWLTLQYLITDYGIYPEKAGIWVIVLIALGTYVFSLDSAQQMRQFTWPQRAIYSLDMLLPVVHLRHHHYEFDLEEWPKYYLYAHKLMGYVLATFLIAAMTGGGGGE